MEIKTGLNLTLETVKYHKVELWTSVSINSNSTGDMIEASRHADRSITETSPDLAEVLTSLARSLALKQIKEMKADVDNLDASLYVLKDE